LKELFSPYGNVAYVDFTKNLNEGYVRYSDAAVTTKAFTEITNNKVQIGDKLPTYAIITGEEEKQYWIKIKKSQFDKNQNFSKKGKKGKPKGRGNNKNAKPKGEKRKKEDTENDESKKSKKVKVE